VPSRRMLSFSWLLGEKTSANRHGILRNLPALSFTLTLPNFPPLFLVIDCQGTRVLSLCQARVKGAHATSHP
jgi:hypothetical protein